MTDYKDHRLLLCTPIQLIKLWQLGYWNRVGILVVFLESPDRGMYIKYIIAETSRLFALCSQYPAGTLGRQIVWIWFMVLACLTVMIGAGLPSQITIKSEDIDDAIEGDEGVNERTALLR
jgi:hypothetical protein